VYSSFSNLAICNPCIFPFASVQYVRLVFQFSPGCSAQMPVAEYLSECRRFESVFFALNHDPMGVSNHIYASRQVRRTGSIFLA